MPRTLTQMASASGEDQPVRSGGQILADQLHLLGADRMFCVPGESFLELLDGLYSHQDNIQVITCRHESGAANMADAYAKMTGKPGICAVTRGPGATNASNGIHTAFQDSTPMIVLIGQVGRGMMDREAFQEMDYRRMFGQMAKWVAQIEDARRIPEYLSRAWKTALSGRPGPVVLALPEDMLSEKVATKDLRPTPQQKAAPLPEDIKTLERMLQQSEKPLLVVGGPSWSRACFEKATALAARIGIPVAASFRCQDYVDNASENYVGVFGIAPLPTLRQHMLKDVDLLIGLGPRFGEMTTQGYSLLDIPNPRMTFVHIHPGAEELGQVYSPDLAVVSDPEAFLNAASGIVLESGTERWSLWRSELRKQYEAFLTPTEVPGSLNMSKVVRQVTETMGPDTIVTNGAGNYTVWVHRFHEHKAYRTQLAPTSGSMGYGIPAAVAAKLAAPECEVVCFAGDGCFLMTAQELATAARYGINFTTIVVNNSMYGTIRLHQERKHPDRVISTDLTNPDFVTYAKAFGIPGERVVRTEDFAAALERARASAKGYLIEVVVDPEALTPTQTLSAARDQGRVNSG